MMVAVLIQKNDDSSFKAIGLLSDLQYAEGSYDYVMYCMNYKNSSGQKVFDIVDNKFDGEEAKAKLKVLQKELPSLSQRLEASRKISGT